MNRYLLILLGATLVIGCQGPGHPKKDAAEQLWRAAERHQAKGEKDLALRACTELVTRYPEQMDYGIPAYSTILTYHLEARDYQAVTALLERLEQDCPDGPFPWPQWWMQGAAASAGLGDTAHAKRLCERVIFQYPHDRHVLAARKMLLELNARKFDQHRDLLSLHYDHAPDKDDGHSAAADRTILETLYGCDWIRAHVLAVSGAYGKNARSFNPKSDAVMDAAWNDCGQWLAAHTNRKQVVTRLSERWNAVLEDGGDIWVKEGGQSDISADVIKRIQRLVPDLKTTQRIHVVQHSNWNENKTTDAALAYTKQHTDYIRIRDANRFLNVKGGNQAFEKAATQHPAFGAVWKAAFKYYNPKHRLDFSDTGELMHILGLGEIGIDDFRKRFFGRSE